MASHEDNGLLSSGGYGSLSERLSMMRHDIRGSLTIVVSGCDMIRMKPELSDKYLNQFSEKSKQIIQLMDEFSHYFERYASLEDQLSIVLPKLKYGAPGQEQSARAAFNEQAAAITQLEQQLTEARSRALSSALGVELDEDELRRLAREAAEIETEITVRRARAFQKIRPPLSESQKAAIVQAATR
jgi:hypothetical protein